MGGPAASEEALGDLDFTGGVVEALLEADGVLLPGSTERFDRTEAPVGGQDAGAPTC